MGRYQSSVCLCVCEREREMGIAPAAVVATRALLCNNHCSKSRPLISRHHQKRKIRKITTVFSGETWSTAPVAALYLKGPHHPRKTPLVCHAARRKPTAVSNAAVSSEEGNDNVRKVLQVILWVAEGTYILWLFLLPYAPGDPVWAISKDTVDSLIGLSLNFFFILPLMNYVGIRVIDAPVLHPVCEGLFNFVIGWTLMFAPLLFTDVKRDRYKGSLDLLWGLQMFLTNTFLIPYMAIRLGKADSDGTPTSRSQLGTLMTNGAPIVGLVGGAACLISGLWAVYGRMDSNFGNLMERWEFLVNYLGSERLAYAFIWDICLYMVFQPWLIGENLQNVQESKVDVVRYLRFVPVIGLAVYLLCLNFDEEP